jgi:hypothetical protein
MKNFDLTDRKWRTFKVTVGALSARGRLYIPPALSCARSSAAKGIVSKRLGSTYRSGRSKQWVKV